MKQLAILFFVLLGLPWAHAQIEVKGTILSEDGNGLPGASVLETGTTNGTISDVDGKFIISVAEGASLTVSFLGYETMNVPINGRSILNIELQPLLSGLEEVVVVGYGTQRRKDLTGSISSVSSTDIENQPLASID